MLLMDVGAVKSYAKELGRVSASFIRLGRRVEGERMSEERKYKRFCSECHRTTYEWFCCGKRTRRVNLQATLRDKVASSCSPLSCGG